MADIDIPYSAMADEFIEKNEARPSGVQLDYPSRKRLSASPSASPRRFGAGRPKSLNCYVYVAYCPSLHRTKIGISGAVMKRMFQLSSDIGAHVELVQATYTPTKAAVQVEREALARLDAANVSEWTWKPPAVAVAAVTRAFDEIGRSQRIDAFVTDDEARAIRIKRLT